MIDDDEGTRTIDLQTLLHSEEPKVPFLMILSSASQMVMGKLFKLEAKEILVGRSRDCEIWLDDESISRRHAKLLREGETYRLVDLGSANGCFVNGVRVGEALLKPGDKLQVGSTTVMLFTLQDRLEQQFQQRVYEAATLDALTELHNRRSLDQVLAREFAYAHRHRLPLSVALADIDHFKSVNDTHGHLVGDFVLWQAARLIRSVVRSEDVVGRYGGEEFCLVMRETNRAQALSCAERCRQTIALAPFRNEQLALRVTISIGVSTVDVNRHRSIADLLQEADAALYRAKANGRNRVEG